MNCRILLFLFCFFLIIIPANALCHWAPEVTPPPGVLPCRGYMDSHQKHWPRLPTNSEIETAKEEYLAYRLSESGKTRIDQVTVVKYHTCEGTWINHVEMEVKSSWWWESITGEGEWQPSNEYSFLIYDPGRDRFEFVLDIGVSPYFAFSMTGAAQGFATGSCSSGGGVIPTSSGGSVSPESDDNSWIVIIGAIAIIGGGLAIGVKKLGSKGKTTSDDKKKEKEKVRYILQLSKDWVTVTPDAPAHLKVTAWKIVGENPPALAPEAGIKLTLPEGNEGLLVQPASGTGSVETRIVLVSQVAKSPVPITVTASAGKSWVSSQVMVEVPAEFQMEFF